MTFEQIIADLPVWTRILIVILMLPAVKTTFEIIQDWQQGSSRERLAKLENQQQSLKNQSQETLSQTQMQDAMTTALREVFDIFRGELNNVTTAIRDAATVNRETANEDRKVLDNNNLLIREFTITIGGLTKTLDSMGASLSEVADVNRNVLKSNEILHSDVKETLNNYQNVLSTIETVREHLAQSVDKKEFGKFRGNMIELFDGLEDAIIRLNMSTQRNADTAPLEKEILDKLEQIDNSQE
ncbi:MAG: hypothetical protein ACPG7F_12905, partial [Aggregatilineales bacterium]